MRSILPKILVLFSLIALSIHLTWAQTEWSELDADGDLLYGYGLYDEAADKYNQSALLALAEGNDRDAARIFAKLARCFAPERLNDPEIFTQSLERSAQIVSNLARLEPDPRKAASMYLDAATYAREGGLMGIYAEKINLSAFSFMAASIGQDVENASSYLRRAAYIFQFNNITQYVGLARSAYEALLLQEADRLLGEAAQAALDDRGEEAGSKYYEAGVRLHQAGHDSAGNVFGLAAALLVTAADSQPYHGANISHQGELYNLAALAATLNHSKADDLFRKAGDAYMLAAGDFLASGRFPEARRDFAAAAETYSAAGLKELSRDAGRLAAETALKISQSATTSRYIYEHQAAETYHRAGLYKEAEQAYTLALQSLLSTAASYLWPWQELDFLDMLGRSGRTKYARDFQRYLSQTTVFFSGALFRAYDRVAELGPSMTQASASRFDYDAHVAETLLVAASLLINDLRRATDDVMKTVQGEALLTDPGMNAFYGLVSTILESRSETISENEVAWLMVEFRALHFEEMSVALAKSLAAKAASTTSYEAAYSLYLQRCRSILDRILEDLLADVYTQTAEDYYVQAQRKSEDLVGTQTRNMTEHLSIAELFQAAGRRWGYQGKLNESAASYEWASFHACAGDDYQRAILYHDLSWGAYGFRTPLTAAAYAISDAMIDDNQTKRNEARGFLLLNLSGYIPAYHIEVMMSVLEGRTDLRKEASGLRMVAMALIGGFALLTSYVLLIWEPKHPVRARPEEQALEEARSDLEDGDEDHRLDGAEGAKAQTPEEGEPPQGREPA